LSKPHTQRAGSPFFDRRKNRFLRRLYAVLHIGLIDLDFETLVKRILQLEIVAIAGIILASWANELYDLPSLLYGAPPSQPNIYECWMETAWALAVMFFVLVITRALLKQIRYLEGFLPVCSFCKKIRVDDHWVPIEAYLQEHADVKMTHSLCPPCAKKHYGYDEDEPA
jgi:hypothetical protein